MNFVDLCPEAGHKSTKFTDDGPTAVLPRTIAHPTILRRHLHGFARADEEHAYGDVRGPLLHSEAGDVTDGVAPRLRKRPRDDRAGRGRIMAIPATGHRAWDASPLREPPDPCTASISTRSRHRDRKNGR
jgi:hypothetical protein